VGRRAEGNVETRASDDAAEGQRLRRDGHELDGVAERAAGVGALAARHPVRVREAVAAEQVAPPGEEGQVED